MSLAERKAALKAMRICRLCLTDQVPLMSIYNCDSRPGKNSIPLPLQIMACVSIEVFPSDGMPQFLCDQCRLQTIRTYKFKTFSKQSDDALKLYLATGNLSKPVKSLAEVLELTESEAQERYTKSGVGEPPLKRIKTNKGQKCIKEIIYLPEVADNSNTYLNEEYDEELYKSELEEIRKMKMNNEKPIVPEVPLNVFPCTQCDRSFPLQQLLDIHMANHCRERNYSCSRCDKLFFSKYDLANHQTVHTGEEPYQCIVCLKTFARSTLLYQHEKIHVNIPKYLCNTCDRIFFAKEALDRHEATHRKIRPFACDKCNKSFAFKQGLERHKKINRTAKPHKCNYCEQRFHTLPTLARHLTSHAGMRPYSCKFCQRTFLFSHNLTRHMRSHCAQKASNKPYYNYKCSECTMQFKRKDGLIGHSIIHSIISQKCMFCFKQFEDLTFVREHVKTHMYERIFRCEKCSYSFITQKHLEDHDETHGVEEGDSTGNFENSQEAASKEDREGNLFEDSELLNDDKMFLNTEQSEEDSTVRRFRPSILTPKIKNYARFIKTELGLEGENDEVVKTEQYFPDADVKSKETSDESKIRATPSTESAKSKKSEEIIKPIPKPDGARTYASKGPKKSPSAKTPTSKPSTEPTLPPELSTLTPEILTQSIDLPTNKVTKGEIIEMKIGDKIVKIQKVLMSKADVEEMARQGKIKMKDGAMLLSQPSKAFIDTTKLPPLVLMKKLPVAEVKSIKKALELPKKSIKEEKLKENTEDTKVKDSKEEAAPTETRKYIRTYIKKAILPTKEK